MEGAVIGSRVSVVGFVVLVLVLAVGWTVMLRCCGRGWFMEWERTFRAEPGEV